MIKIEVIFTLLCILSIFLVGCSETRYYSNCASCRDIWNQDIDRAIAGINISGNGTTDLTNYFTKTEYWSNLTNKLANYLTIVNWQSNITGYYTKTQSDSRYALAGSSSCQTLFYDEFTLYATARTNGVGTCAAVSSGTAAAVTDVYQGVIRFSDSTTANGGFRCYSDYTTYFLGGEKFTARFKPNTNVLNTTIRIGFADSTTITAPTDGCYLNCLNLVCTGSCKNNAGPTNTATTYTLSANTWYVFTGEMNSAATSFNFTIWNADKTTVLWTKNVAANIPNTSARVFGTVLEAYQSSTSAAAILVNWDYAKLEDCTWT